MGKSTLRIHFYQKAISLILIGQIITLSLGQNSYAVLVDPVVISQVREISNEFMKDQLKTNPNLDIAVSTEELVNDLIQNLDQNSKTLFLIEWIWKYLLFLKNPNSLAMTKENQTNDQFLRILCEKSTPILQQETQELLNAHPDSLSVSQELVQSYKSILVPYGIFIGAITLAALSAASPCFELVNPKIRYFPTQEREELDASCRLTQQFFFGIYEFAFGTFALIPLACTGIGRAFNYLRSSATEESSPHPAAQSLIQDIHEYKKMIRTAPQIQKLLHWLNLNRLESYHLIEECSICLDAFYERDTSIEKTPCCKHFFHKSCLSKWKAIRPTCPYCRAGEPPDGH